MIDWIRSLFCKHEWEHISDVRVYENDYSQRPCGREKVFYCKKCMKKKIIKY